MRAAASYQLLPLHRAYRKANTMSEPLFSSSSVETQPIGQCSLARRIVRPQLVPVFANRRQAEGYARGNLQAVLWAECKERKARLERTARANQARIAQKLLTPPPAPPAPPAPPTPPVSLPPPDILDPLIREATATIRKAQPTIPLELIQKVVAAFYDVTRADILGNGRTAGRRSRGHAVTLNVIRPRQVAIYLAKNLTKRTLQDIGNRFGRDHTTVLHACRKIEALRQLDPQLDAEIMNLAMDIHRRSGARLAALTAGRE